MINILLTALIPVLFFSMVALPDKTGERSRFFSKNQTTALKGLAAIVVIFVHVPAEYGNPLQDAIGSFGYIAVTYFFLVSAYGMQLGAETKAGYLDSFWKNRAASLLIPMLLINLLFFCARLLLSDTPDYSLLTDVNPYVSVLLTYCLWFWCLEMTGRYFRLKRKTIDAVNISGVVISSLTLYFTGTTTGWGFERMGLVWGLLLFRYFPAFRQWLGESQRPKRLAFLASSLALGVIYLKFKDLYFWGGYLVKVMLGLSVLVCVAVWSDLMNLSNRVLRFLGGISYEIYLIHALFMLMLKDYLTVRVSSGLFILITFVSVIIISYPVSLAGKLLVKMVRQSDLTAAVRKCFSRRAA